MLGLFPIELSPCFFATAISLKCYEIDKALVDRRKLFHSCPALPEDIQNSVESRKIEYLAGRYCAGQALGQLGAFTSIIGRNDDGSPHWPMGTLGSLSHTSDRVIACVAYQSEWIGLGIDVERIIEKPMLQPLESLVFTIADKLQIDQVKLPLLEAATLVFSAKESFFKFIYPQTHALLDFRDVSLLEIKDGEFVIGINKDLGIKWRKGNQVLGRYLFESNNVITLIAEGKP